MADGINAVQTLFPNMWFDRERCADGLQALRHYRFDLDANGQFSRSPLHDNAGNGSDAPRYVVVAMRGRGAGCTKSGASLAWMVRVIELERQGGRARLRLRSDA